MLLHAVLLTVIFWQFMKQKLLLELNHAYLSKMSSQQCFLWMRCTIVLPNAISCHLAKKWWGKAPRHQTFAASWFSHELSGRFDAVSSNTRSGKQPWQHLEMEVTTLTCEDQHVGNGWSMQFTDLYGLVIFRACNCIFSKECAPNRIDLDARVHMSQIVSYTHSAVI